MTEIFSYNFRRLTAKTDSKLSEINMFTDHKKMLECVMKTNRKAFYGVIANFMSETGFRYPLEILFYEHGQEISKNIDGYVKEIKSIDINMANFDIPYMVVNVRL